MANRTDRELWVEVSVVLLALLVPMYLPIVDLIGPIHRAASASESFSLGGSLRNIINDTSGSVLLLYFIWRSSEPWSRFGLTRSQSITLDTNIVLGIILINAVISEGFFLLFGDIHVDDSGIKPSTSPGTVLLVTEYAFFVIHICVSAFYEELLMRGYLIPRFEHLLRSTWISWFLTALLFGGFHMDQGVGGVLSITLAGLVYGGAFC